MKRTSLTPLSLLPDTASATSTPSTVDPDPVTDDRSRRGPGGPRGCSRPLALAALALTALVAGGCASGRSTPSALGQLEPSHFGGRPVEVVVAGAPNFYADNKQRRRFGIVGVAAMALEGNRLVRDHRLVDPSVALADSLRRSIAERGRFANPAGGSGAPLAVATVGDTRGLSSLGTRNTQAATTATTTADADRLALHVRTTNWEYRPFRGDPTQFYVIYSVRIDLVERRTGRNVGTDRCEVTPTLDARLTEDQLLADDARKLKEELAAASGQCFTVLRDSRIAALLGMGPPVADAQQAQ